ncbi:hypothetical protein NliqN6_3752 [Naganishia liquefaciens]|uniref:Methyltransferase domain-containing protein n=1 Tax=Naganishia liquefaciens TaxID=104408 RepID=A0A8H3TUA2_9TREE|nr:hypothetical protein NliqN6_3752 [Naganishia liquefaciens]
MTLPSVITGGGTDLVTAIQSYTNNQSPNSAPKSKDRLAAGTLSHYANGSSGFIRDRSENDAIQQPQREPVVNNADISPNRLYHAASGYLGSGVSTFFSQHRAGSLDTRDRPATSQRPRIPGFSDNVPKNGWSKKRNPFRRQENRAPSQQHEASPQQQRKQQQQQQQDRIPTVDSDESRERLCTLQRAAHAAGQISVQVGEYQPGHPSEYRGSSSTTQAEAGSNGCNRSRSRGPIGTSPFPMSSRRSSLSQVEAMAQTESNHFSEKTRMCEHVKNALGHESQGQARADKRASYFTWNINPSLTEGQELMGFGGDLGKKRLQVSDEAGNLWSAGSDDITKSRIPYIIGFEKQVLAFEPLIHDAFFSLAGDKHTFYPPNSPPPKRVLDIGTGTGIWPITMAQRWRETTFVGLDISAIQTDLHALTKAQRMLAADKVPRATSAAETDWQDLADRVTWHVADFLHGLPFEEGSFDMVHIRFVGLGVPESSWDSLFAEVSRVLKRDTGVMEVVEMSKILPLTTPHSLRASFATLMLSSFIHQYPFIPILPALATTEFAIEATWKTVLRSSENDLRSPTNVLLQAMGIWVDSALGKGKHGRGKGMSGHAYGRLSGKSATSKLAESARWGETIMGERALAEYLQLPNQKEQAGTPRETDNPQKVEPCFVRLPSGFSADIGSQFEVDEVNLMVWLARRK